MKSLALYIVLYWKGLALIYKFVIVITALPAKSQLVGGK